MTLHEERVDRAVRRALGAWYRNRWLTEARLIAFLGLRSLRRRHGFVRAVRGHFANLARPRALELREIG